MGTAGLEELQNYTDRRHNEVDQYIYTWTFLDLFLESGKRLGEWVAKRWWAQEGMSLAIARVEIDEGGMGGADR